LEARAEQAVFVGSAWDLLAGHAGWLRAVSATGVDVHLDVSPSGAGGRPPGVVWQELMAELPPLRLDGAAVSVRRSRDVLDASGAALELGPPGDDGRPIALDIGALRRLRGEPDADAAAPSTGVHGRFAWTDHALLLSELALSGGPLDGRTRAGVGRRELPH